MPLNNGSTYTAARSPEDFHTRIERAVDACKVHPEDTRTDGPFAGKFEGSQPRQRPTGEGWFLFRSTGKATGTGPSPHP